MGWTGTPLQGREITPELVLAEALGAAWKDRVVEYGSASEYGVLTVFAAVRDVDGTDKVWAAVILAERQGGFVYVKVMDEEMGPNDARCPANVLGALTETDAEYALDWRSRAAAYQGTAA